MKKTISFILALVFLLSAMPVGMMPAFATVTETAPVEGGDGWQVVTTPIANIANGGTVAQSAVTAADGSIALVANKTFRFVLLRDAKYQEMAGAFAAAITKNTGATVSYGSADVTQQYELVIGSYSARSSSVSIYNEVKGARADNANDYIIRLVGTKLYILGATDYALQNALDYFVELFLKDSSGSLPTNYEYYHKPKHVTYTLAGNNIAEYTIRTERYPSQVVQMAAQTIQKTIIDECGYILEIKAMNLEGTDAGNKEIRVGPMNGAVNVDRIYDTRFTSADWEQFYTRFEGDGMLDADYGYYQVRMVGNSVAIEGGSAYAVNVGVARWLADLAAKKTLSASYQKSGNYQSGYDYKNGTGYDAVDFSMTDGFGLVYAEEFDYTGNDADKEKKVKSKWSISTDSTPEPDNTGQEGLDQVRPGVYGQNWWVATDTAGNNYLFEVTKKRSEKHGDTDSNGYEAVRLVSGSKWGFRYGIWETRIVMGTRNGACSAVWSNTMAPYDSKLPSHEIDVYENYGRDVFVPCLHAFWPGEKSKNYLFGTPHLQSPCWLEPNEGEHYYDTFHHMSVDWTYDYIKIYFDGQLASEMALDDEHPRVDSFRNGQTIKLANGIGNRGYCRTGVPPVGTQTEIAYTPNYWMSLYGGDVNDFFEVQVVDYTRVYQSSNEYIDYAPAQNDIRFTTSFDNLSDDGGTSIADDVQSFEDYMIGDKLALNNSSRANITVSDDIPGYTGNRVAKVYSSDGSGNGRPQMEVKDADNKQIYVYEGRDYEFTFRMFLPEDYVRDDDKFNYWLAAPDSDQCFGNGYNKNDYVVAEVTAAHYDVLGEWLTVTIPVENCAHTGRLRLGITSNGSMPHTFYIDDLQLIEIKEEPKQDVQSYEDMAYGDSLSPAGSNAVTVTNEDSHTGAYSAKVSATGNSVNGVPQMILTDKKGNPLTVQKGANYQLVFWVAAANDGVDYSTVRYWLAATDDDTLFTDANPRTGIIQDTTVLNVDSKGKWHQVVVLISDCSASGTVRLGISGDVSAAHTLYVDDVQMEKRITVTVESSAMNFENYSGGETVCLNPDGNKTITVSDYVAYTGNFSAMINSNNPSGNGRPQMNVVDSTGKYMTVEKGKDYSVTFMLYIPEEQSYTTLSYWLTAVPQNVADVPFDGANFKKDDYVLAELSAGSLPDEGRWHQINIPITDCPYTGVLRLGVMHGDNSKWGYLFVDDVMCSEPQQMTVKFVTNGGNSINDVDVTIGALLPYNDIKVTRDGYTFMGWYTDPYFSADSHFNIYGDRLVGADGDVMTLYAAWRAEEHVYSSACDTVCDDCGYVRQAPSAHLFDDSCDEECNVCGSTRQAPHTYVSDCDVTCELCGDIRTWDVAHTYDNVCDAECNICGYTRSIKHTYDSNCDSVCNVCGDTRETNVVHTYEDIYDVDCSVCGNVRQLTDVSVNRLPDVLRYEPNTELDTTGLELMLTYDDGTTGTVDSGYTVSGFDSATAGDKTVTVTYGGKSTQFTVTVAYSPTVMVDSCRTVLGATVEVQVRLAHNSGIVSFKGNVSYDATVLSFVSMQTADFEGVKFDSKTMSIRWSDPDGVDNATDGVLATLVFRVLDDAAAGVSTIGITYNENDVYNTNSENVSFKTEDGEIEVLDSVCGDANGDGGLNNKDLSALMRYLNGWDEPIDEMAADVNRDGIVNNKDYVLLMRYLNGWEVVLK